MAGEWLKFDCALPDKPETLAITVAMGWDDPDLTVGKLMRLFRWFDQHTLDGNAKNVTPAVLDRLMGAPGFVKALSDAGWMQILDSGLALQNFDKHNGQTAKRRSETAKRVATHRAKVIEVDVVRGNIPRPIRAAVYARDKNACVYCDRKEGEYGPLETSRDGILHIDHVIPLSQGGSDDLKNLVTACGPCNLFKSDRNPDECALQWPILDGVPAGNKILVTPALAREEKRREEKKENQKTLAPQEGRFPEFWTLWPKNERKQDRNKCAAKWKAKGYDSIADEILADVVVKMKTTKWRDGFQESPLVYLNNERWRDGVTPDGPRSSSYDLDDLAKALQ